MGLPRKERFDVGEETRGRYGVINFTFEIVHRFRVKAGDVPLRVKITF